MARTLLLRYMGNDLKFLIPDFRPLSSGAQLDTLGEVWDYIGWSPNSPNIPTFCGYAAGQTVLAYQTYYQLIASAADGCHNMFLPSAYSWDTEWPGPCGENKIRIPSQYGNWTCPANGRYCVWGNDPNPGDQTTECNVFDEDGNYITMNSGGSYRVNNFTIRIGNIIFMSVYDWDGFRHASTFNDAKNYCCAISMTIAGTGKILVQNATDTDKSFLRVLWDFTRVFGGDDDDPTEESSDDPYSGDDSPYEPGGEGGGDGDGTDPYDPGDDIDYPDDPDIGLSDSGLLGVYIPSSTQLHLLGGYIWSQNFVDSLVKSVYADPMDVIISIGVVPFNIPAAGTRDVKVGDRTASFAETTVRSDYPASDYFNYDCGNIKLESTIGCYLDYAPYTKGHIFIPFVGYVPLDIDYYMGKHIGLKYKVELVTGTAVAFLMADGKVLQQFTCNVKMLIPLTSANATQMWDSLLKTTVAAGALVASGGAAGGLPISAPMNIGGEEIQVTSGEISNRDAANIMNGIATKPSFQKSNPHGVSGGFVGSKLKPYIIVERPNMQLPTDQGKYTGYGAYATKKLGNLRGFTRVSSSKLSLPNCTGREYEAILKALHNGVFINGTPATPQGDLVLFKNGSPGNTIGKSLTNVATLTGNFRDSANVSELTVRIERTSPIGFNYIYSSKFGRFYFVNEITVVRTGILDLHCVCDELESFGADILANTVIIDKQEKDYNLYLNDDGLKIQQNPLVQTIYFPHGFGEAYEYVMVVAGYQGGS